MRRTPCRWKFLIMALFLLVSGGCAGDPIFAYKPGPAPTGLPKVPVGLAVVAFADGTENFTQRGSIFEPESLVFNLAKTGISGWTGTMSPELWAKAFADEMAAAETFRSVRFIYGSSEVADEEYYVEGTLTKAYAAGGWHRLNEFALNFRAVRKSDGTEVWKKDVERAWKTRKELYDACGRDMGCSKIAAKAETNRILQGMFAEAGADLTGTLASLLGIRAPVETTGKPDGAVTPASAQSVEQTIEDILREK